MLDSIFISSL